MPPSDLAGLLERDTVSPALRDGARALAEHAALAPPAAGPDPRRRVEAVIGELDRIIAAQLGLVLHHPEFQQMESTWRGLRFLITAAETGPMLKIKFLDIGKRDLTRALRKFRGTAWDQSPLFRRIYDEEYGQLGGEPFGVLIGDYYFDHRPEDMQLLGDIAQIAAAAHTPFVAGAAPSVMQMDSWAELTNPRDLTRIFTTPEYAAWRAFRQSEDSRYVGLCLPRYLARLPYGARTEPTDGFDFEEEADGPDGSRHLWANAAFAMGANILRAFSLYGWCVRIRGIDGGGAVEDLPVLTFPTADGDTDRRCSIEVALSERREGELSRNGFIPLVHRRGDDVAAFVGAQSVQRPVEYADAAATANAALATQLPYLFACCRFAHYLKCMVRDKIGGNLDRGQLQDWLNDWLRNYIDGTPDHSDDDWKASHPLIDAGVTVDARDDQPGQYEARFFLRPHFQLEGLTAALRLVSRLPMQ